MTQTKVMAINFPFPCSWGVNMRFAPIDDSLSVDVPESSPTGLASWHSRESVFDRLKLSTSTFLRSLRSMPITALLRSYGRSDSCPLGSSALSSMNTVSSSRQVSLLHVRRLLAILSPPTSCRLTLPLATPLGFMSYRSCGLGFALCEQAHHAHPAVSCFSSYGLAILLLLLSTVPLSTAVTVEYRMGSSLLKRTFTTLTSYTCRRTHTGEGRCPLAVSDSWIPAFAGMTNRCEKSSFGDLCNYKNV